MDSGNSVLLMLLLQIFLILVNAVFSCAEIAIISINDKKLEKMAAAGKKSAIRLSKITEQPSRFLSIIQIGTTLAGFMGSAFAAGNFSEGLTNWFISVGIRLPESILDSISVIFITLVLAFFTIVFGELVPKRLAMRKAENIGLAMSGFIYLTLKIFAPAVTLLSVSTNRILKLVGIDPNAEVEAVTEEEIRLMVDAGTEKGVIDFDEKEFIHNIFDFNDKTAEEVMTHRTDVVLLWQDESYDAWEETINNSAHSVYPICGDDVDNVVGILSTKNYFRLKKKTKDCVMEHCVKSAYFVPETVRTDVLFRNMKKTRNHFAVVLDEYGGMSGIITMNDLLEELVGDLENDASAPEEQPVIEVLDSKTWKIHGSASLDVVSEHLGIALPEEDYDTFGGLVFGMLGTVPDDGTTMELEKCGLNIKIIEIREHRLEIALVCLIEEDKIEE